MAALITEFEEERRVGVSTWVASICLFMGAGAFVYAQEARAAKDWLWNLIFQLQMVRGRLQMRPCPDLAHAHHFSQVGVPLTVLIVATMGVRCYADVVQLFLLLSAAVNTLWLQSTLQGNALYLSKLLTVALPSICIYMTQGALVGWEQITAFMAAISLAPLLVMPVILNMDDTTSLRGGVDIDRFQMRLGFLCSSGALLSTILNLAML